MTRTGSAGQSMARRETRISKKRVKFFLAGLMVVAICGAVRYYWGAPPASADSHRDESRQADAGRADRDRHDDARDADDSSDAPRSAKTKGDEPSIPAIVATVNTTRVSSDELAAQCVRQFGKEVLESLVNKQLITLACRQQGINVTHDEVDREIRRMAKRFKIPVEQWLKLLKKERNITLEQYADDIIWPTIALRKLAGVKLTISPEEVQREIETQYGEQVRVRLIALSMPEKAESVRAKCMAHPDDFGNLAKKYSEDAPSAAVKGVINPIRRHGSYEAIERVVFKMRDGDISPVIEAGNQYVIIKREQGIEARPINREDVAPRIEEFLRDRKTREVAQEVFGSLQKKAVAQKAIQIVWNDPSLRKKYPGVAALVYDDEISMNDLKHQCLVRHGREVLEGVISHKVVEIECKRRNITVTEKEIDRDIERAALEGVRAKKDGSPDVAAWLDMIKKRGVSIDVYRNDVIWTSLALKKLVSEKVSVTDEDLKKGYEANYGERVRCKAIVFNDMRRAQQVFEMARKNNTSEHFGKLATQYSVEPGSQALEGDVPPIRRFGSQPLLEEEAFQLKKGELSGIIEAGDKYVILRCEGRTKPIGVTFAEVRDEIYNGVFERKLQVAMSQKFEDLQEAAVIDNYLAGTSHSPKPPAAARFPKLQEMPAK